MTDMAADMDQGTQGHPQGLRGDNDGVTRPPPPGQTTTVSPASTSTLSTPSSSSFAPPDNFTDNPAVEVCKSLT